MPFPAGSAPSPARSRQPGAAHRRRPRPSPALPGRRGPAGGAGGGSLGRSAAARPGAAGSGDGRHRRPRGRAGAGPGSLRSRRRCRPRGCGSARAAAAAPWAARQPEPSGECGVPGMAGRRRGDTPPCCTVSCRTGPERTPPGRGRQSPAGTHTWVRGGCGRERPPPRWGHPPPSVPVTPGAARPVPTARGCKAPPLPAGAPGEGAQPRLRGWGGGGFRRGRWRTRLSPPVAPGI